MTAEAGSDGSRDRSKERTAARAGQFWSRRYDVKTDAKRYPSDQVVVFQHLKPTAPGSC